MQRSRRSGCARRRRSWRPCGGSWTRCRPSARAAYRAAAAMTPTRPLNTSALSRRRATKLFSGHVCNDLYFLLMYNFGLGWGSSRVVILPSDEAVVLCGYHGTGGRLTWVTCIEFLLQPSFPVVHDNFSLLDSVLVLILCVHAWLFTRVALYLYWHWPGMASWQYMRFAASVFHGCCQGRAM